MITLPIKGPPTRESSVIYETYTCSTSDQMIEYGFTFKEEADSEDSLFDLVIGVLPPEREVDIATDLRAHVWAAKAVVSAAPRAS